MFLVFLLWWFISVAKNNVQGSSNSSSQYHPQETVQLKLIVVEEHHEALAAWADAFTHGVLTSSATLLRLDAHAEDQSPKLTSKFPDFRRPKTEEEVDHMIQGNSRFIEAAQLTHILRRTVWIYPYWNWRQELYQNKIIHLGKASLLGRHTVCECEKSKGGSLSCLVNSEGQRRKIASKLCAIRLQVQSEAIRDVYARTRLPAEKGWLGTDPLILDIDEDFFGIKFADNYLLKSGLRWSDVKELSKAVNRMFCPKVPMHELAADRWFFSFVDALRTSCDSRRSSSKLAVWCDDLKATTTKFLRPFRSDKRFSKMFCGWNKSAGADFTANRSFMELWSVLRHLTHDQLLEVRRTGICLEQSMRMQELPRFHLCIGRNSFNSSAVAEHYPSPAELTQQFDRLRAILTGLPHRPRLITLARSSRDGFVPRDLQADIERRIIAILRDVFKLKDEDIFFDKLLLNGAKGDWYNRLYTD